MSATDEALGRVDRFIAERRDLTREGVVQPGQGSTNRVVFARRGQQTIVFKVFCEPQRKERECFGLRHWRATGLVPDLIWDIDATMIAISYVPGHWLKQARQFDGEAAWARACGQTAQAIARLTKVPLSEAARSDFESRFYGELGSLEAYLWRILELAGGIHARDREFRDAFWGRSLKLIESNLAYILEQPRVLYHQDVANFHVQGGRFQGFFDLEMCRVGCEAMQLGAALGMLEDDAVAWRIFREEYASATGAELSPRDVQAALAVRQLLGWREISRYLSYDGTPGTGYAWASPADAAWYRRAFEAASAATAD